MNVAVLFSGGKDSVFSAYKAMQAGHKVVCLVTIIPKRTDSFMYHVINAELTKFHAEAMEIPLIVGKTSGIKEKELSVLKQILGDLKRKKLIQGVVSGAVKSNYQRKRIEKICKELSLKSITPLWHLDEEKLMKEFIKAKFKAIIVGVYALGFNEKWLGKEINLSTLKQLVGLQKKFKVSIVGEGGEFESFVLDAPFFKKKLKIEGQEKHWKGLMWELKIKKVKLVDKKVK